MPDVKAKIALVLCPPFWLKTPPLGLEYLKNYLKKTASIDIYDLNIRLFTLLHPGRKRWLTLDQDYEEGLFSEAEKRCTKEIDRLVKRLAGYDYVGFSLFKRNLPFSLRLAERIGAASQKTRIIFGGPQVRESKGLLPPGTIRVEGEGEIPLSKIAEGEKAKAFSYREIPDLDSLAFNDFRSFDLSLYKPVLPLLSSRGCVRRCRFCAECTLYHGFRQHSPGYMADQIEHLQRRTGTSHFSFQDSLINADIGWLRRLCQKITGRKLAITWEAQLMIRPDMDRDTLSLMKRAGCINLFIGLESGSDAILTKMGKGFTKDQARALFQDLQEAGLTFEVSLIVGYPGESDADFKETLSFLKENRRAISTIAQVSSFTLYRGSSLARKDKPRLTDEKEVRARMRKVVRLIEKEKIRHKKAFIDNLRYEKICR